MSQRNVRRAALYVRISLSTEESVSIDRQIEAGQQYAAARGWTVMGVFRDEGVSATHNRPDDRRGWNELLTSRESYDAVIIWKVDRLARRVIDFLNANEAVKARGAGIVAVEDPIDMTTAQGEAFAIMLAVFGQLESATMRARGMAARDYLLRSGRWAGGAPPYGYRLVPNPSGPGYVAAQNPSEIPYVRTMVERTLAGKTIYSTVQWLNEQQVPTPTWRPPLVWHDWNYNSVNRLVRHPMLAGMVPHNPGNAEKTRGADVVRDENGLPVIDEALAVMSVTEWRTMQAKLAEPSPHRQPRATRRKHRSVLSGLMWCGDPRHDKPVRMRRATITTGSKEARPAYACPKCHQSISSIEDLVVAEFLRECGDDVHLSVVEEVIEGGSVQEQEATIRLAELGREVAAATPERMVELVAEMQRVKEIQEQARALPSQVRMVPVGPDRTYTDAWADAATDEDRRALLGHAIDRIVVSRGPRGRRTEADKVARMAFHWAPRGQYDRPDGASLEAWATEDLRL